MDVFVLKDSNADIKLISLCECHAPGSLRILSFSAFLASSLNEYFLVYVGSAPVSVGLDTIMSDSANAVIQGTSAENIIITNSIADKTRVVFFIAFFYSS